MNKTEQAVDGKLVSEYLSGNHKALVSLVKRWHKLFCEKAFWIVKDPDVSKDIAQDSWQSILGKMHTLKEPDYFGSWALRIVHNKSIDWVKTKHRKQSKLEVYKQKQIAIIAEEDEFVNKEFLQDKLLKAIKQLPENQYQVICLFYVENYSLKEISKTLNISVGTAKSRLFHAREKLKLIIKTDKS